MPKAGSPSAGSASSDVTEKLALEAMELFARTLARAGLSPARLASAFASACARIPRRIVAGRSRGSGDIVDAAHILAIWFSDPRYLNTKGDPIRLRARGADPSLQALIRRVDPILNVKDVLDYLTRARAIKRVGGRYALRTRTLFLRSTGAPGRLHALRAVLGLLKTLEHNSSRKSGAAHWFEHFAENPRLPVRARAQVDTKLDRLGLNFLNGMDADMQLAAQNVRPGEPTVRVGIGVYRFEEEGESLPNGVTNNGKTSRRRAR
jgi:Family of unknown function (DUF6502)